MKETECGARNEMDFIFCDNPGIVQDLEVLGRLRCSDHRMVGSRIRLDFRRSRNKVELNKPINELRATREV